MRRKIGQDKLTPGWTDKRPASNEYQKHFYRVGKLISNCSQYCSTAVSFNKANMLTLGVQNIREMHALCTALACPVFKRENKIKRGSHATP